MDTTALIVAILASIKNATDIARFIYDSDISLEKAETKLQIADLIKTLADAKISFAEIQQGILDKDKEIVRLQEALSVKGRMLYEHPFYWITGDNKDGPFCQQCYDNENKLMRLTSLGGGSWECKTCKNVYNEKSFGAVSCSDGGADYDPLRHRFSFR